MITKHPYYGTKEMLTDTQKIAQIKTIMREAEKELKYQRANESLIIADSDKDFVEQLLLNTLKDIRKVLNETNNSKT